MSPALCEEYPLTATGSLIQPIVEKLSPSFNLLIVKKTIFSLSTCSIFTIATVTSLSTNDTSLSVIRARRDTHTLSHAIATWRVCIEKQSDCLFTLSTWIITRFYAFVGNHPALRVQHKTYSTCLLSVSCWNYVQSIPAKLSPSPHRDDEWKLPPVTSQWRASSTQTYHLRQFSHSYQQKYLFVSYIYHCFSLSVTCKIFFLVK